MAGFFKKFFDRRGNNNASSQSAANQFSPEDSKAQRQEEVEEILGRVLDALGLDADIDVTLSETGMRVSMNTAHPDLGEAKNSYIHMSPRQGVLNKVLGKAPTVRDGNTEFYVSNNMDLSDLENMLDNDSITPAQPHGAELFEVVIETLGFEGVTVQCEGGGQV